MVDYNKRTVPQHPHLKQFNNAHGSGIDNHASPELLRAMKGTKHDYVHERSLSSFRKQQREEKPNNYTMRNPSSMVDARQHPGRNGAAKKELERRNQSPAYQVQANLQGKNWNNDAQVSQRELNDIVQRERTQKKSHEIIWNRMREDAWDDSTQDNFRDRHGQKIPLRPMEGMLPVGSGTADPILAKRHRYLSGSSFIPKIDPSNIRGRMKDEQTLMKMFRSFDDNYDGQLQTKEFTEALQYMGLKDVDSLIRSLDPDDTGEIEYSKAISAIQVKPGNACDFKSGRVLVEAVPHGEKPLASDRNNRDGELGKTSYSSVPWASAGMRDTKMSKVSKMVESQLLMNKGGSQKGVKFGEGHDFDSLRLLQENYEAKREVVPLA